MKHLEFIVKRVQEHTDISVNIFSEDLKHVLFDETPILPDKQDFAEIYTSHKQQRVFFKFRYKGVPFIGSLQGAQKQSENYAYLLLSLIENYHDDSDGISFSETVRRIITGEAPLRMVEKFMRENNIPSGECFCLTLLKERSKTGEITAYLEKSKKGPNDLFARIDDNTIAYIKIAGTDFPKIQPEEFALSLYNDIYRSLGERAVIGVGTYKSQLNKAVLSFKEALTAMKINGFLYNNSSIHSYKTFMLIRLLEDLPKYRLKEVTNTLLSEEGQKIFEDEEMLRTAEVLMDNNLNISEAARELYMHRNTLTYRLDKIQRLTNLNIRQFSDAVSFRILSVIKKITD